MSKAEDPARVEEEEEEEEEEDLSELVSEKLLVAEDAVKAMEAPKPFAAFGSYRQRHGEIESINVKAGMSSEAPAKLMADHPPASADATEDGEEDRSSSTSMPVSIPRPPGDKAGSRTMRRKVVRNYRWREAEREEAWERKREQQQMEEEENRMARAVGRSVSDCGLRRTGSGGISAAAAAGKSRFRARSLTDEDLDELRGSIDLGFGFSNQADPELWNTLPALELCYAISQQYHNKGSPVSNSTPEDDGSVMSEGSPTSSSWTISSPGDHPQQVKTRLRHWAQAVACTVRQNYQQELY